MEVGTVKVPSAVEAHSYKEDSPSSAPAEGIETSLLVRDSEYSVCMAPALQC